jgi:NitT/TauT family transport system substrate-binding protein
MQLRIGYLSTMYHTSHVIRHLRWVEDRIGVQPLWSLFGTGPAMVQAFASGTLDLGYIGLPPAMIGIARGLPLVCVAGGHVEGTVMIARRGYTAARDVDTLQAVLGQFAGKNLGTPAAGSIHDVIARSLLNDHAVRDAAVKNYAWADLLPEAIERGDIEGAFGTPPLAVLAGTWYDHRIVVPPPLLWPCNPSYGIVTTRAMLERTDILQPFLMLHEEACNLILRQPDEAARAVAGALKVIDAEFVKKVFRISPRYCAQLPEEYVSAAMRFIPVLRRLGYMQRDLTSAEVFDLSCISAIHPEGHHYSEPMRP